MSLVSVSEPAAFHSADDVNLILGGLQLPPVL